MSIILSRNKKNIVPYMTLSPVGIVHIVLSSGGKNPFYSPMVRCLALNTIVYMMACKCRAYYIDKTKQEFWRQISKHVDSMDIGNRYPPVGRHVVLQHNYKMPKVTFTTLDRIHIADWGGDWNKVLLQHEQIWIFKLQVTTFPGKRVNCLGK